MIKDGFLKMTLKTKIALWFYDRFNSLAQWFIRRCNHHPCEKCRHHDHWGCVQDLALGAPCIFEAEDAINAD